MKKLTFIMLLAILLASCSKNKTVEQKTINNNQMNINLQDVAKIFSALPLEKEQVEEVFDAVSRSSENGYDEEYMIKDLLVEPGCGVGDQRTRSAGHVVTRNKIYSNPLKNMIKEHLNKTITRSSKISVDDYLNTLSSSNYQIYWPNSEKWNKEQLPIITFNPLDGNNANIGYEMYEENGEKKIREVTVTEEIAEERPVWVINQNEDSYFESLALKRKLDPNWGHVGGNIKVNNLNTNVIARSTTKDNSNTSYSLLLSKFKAKRNYDNWFAGASEFFVKAAVIDKFTASTEAELKLFQPYITDFMIVVKRKFIRTEIPYDIIVMSDWKPQLETIAFMIIEDDGGSQTKWEAEVSAKVKSKSYALNVSIPLNTRDDIVWRGNLSKDFFLSNNNKFARFGDVELCFNLKPNQ